MLYDMRYFQSNDSLLRQFSSIERNANKLQNVPNTWVTIHVADKSAR